MRRNCDGDRNLQDLLENELEHKLLEKNECSPDKIKILSAVFAEPTHQVGVERFWLTFPEESGGNRSQSKVESHTRCHCDFQVSYVRNAQTIEATSQI